jgi:hypothetical protein
MLSNAKTSEICKSVVGPWFEGGLPNTNSQQISVIPKQNSITITAFAYSPNGNHEIGLRR